MPRPIHEPELPEHVAREHIVKRIGASLRRPGKPKLRIVPGTALARFLGIGDGKVLTTRRKSDHV